MWLLLPLSLPGSLFFFFFFFSWYHWCFHLAASHLLCPLCQIDPYLYRERVLIKNVINKLIYSSVYFAVGFFSISHVREKPHSCTGPTDWRHQCFWCCWRLLFIYFCGCEDSVQSKEIIRACHWWGLKRGTLMVERGTPVGKGKEYRTGLCNNSNNHKYKYQ